MNKKISDIQILRALAILFVLLQHFSLTPTIINIFPVKITLPLYIGVELFFVISGYVVARSFFSGTKITPIYFYSKRIFRIYPALFVFILLCYLSNLISTSINLPEGVVDIFSLPWDNLLKRCLKILLGIYINSIDALNTEGNPLAFGAMWSLSVEFQFYTFVFLLGLILVFVTKNNKYFIENFFLFLFIFFYIYILISRLMILFNYSTNLFIKNYIVSYDFDFLLLGFVLAIIQKKEWISPKFFLHKESAMFMSPILLVIPLFLTSISESPFAKEQIIMEGISSPIIGLCFTILIYLASTSGCFPGEKSRLYSVLSWIGDRSYTIYLFHFPFFILIWILFYKLFPLAFSNDWNYGFAQMIVTALLLTPFVEFIYRYLELPLIEYSHKFIFKRLRP
ncbi:acyltransferase family protein [Aphanothece sacrum]|uniref:Acyltransferase 3 n=1 Tax=Aphanothece sacrum FPU1 TaxID=1920663 RepID=A0A401IGV0_APHSA|nr:acyltransferase [Aphanothece sacrum]GBF80517.1 acyltransferase 3 [Aphanothece sacrum FPU1]GBF85908.1 acyltransferase 3 [Aphanothece sacrum FPU3]